MNKMAVIKFPNKKYGVSVTLAACMAHGFVNAILSVDLIVQLREL